VPKLFSGRSNKVVTPGHPQYGLVQKITPYGEEKLQVLGSIKKNGARLQFADEPVGMHELAKVEEIKNIPIINVLDAARPPVKKWYPKRSFAAVLAFVLSFVVSAGFAGFGEWGRKTLKVLRLTFGDNRLVSVDSMAGKTEERDMPDAESGRGG
jgi:hypothetical protein